MAHPTRQVGGIASAVGGQNLVLSPAAGLAWFTFIRGSWQSRGAVKVSETSVGERNVERKSASKESAAARRRRNVVPQWDREPTPKTYTRPHRRLMEMLGSLGLLVQGEYPVGRYRLDVFCAEIWCGFEADGLRAHAGPKRRAHDEARDAWIFENAGIPVLRIQEAALRRICWADTEKLVQEFIERFADDLAARREKGKWLVD